jgi:hypothetical protein
VEHEALTDRISILQERADRTRGRAAVYAGLTAVFMASEVGLGVGFDFKSAAVNTVSSLLLALGAGGATYNSVSYGLESVQTGHEVAALTTEQAREGFA